MNGKYRYSYYAVISTESALEDISADSEVAYDGETDGMSFSISSAGFLVGNRSSILIDRVEYSNNVRGMIFVIYDLKDKQVAEAVAFDTYALEMRLTR